MMNCKAGRQAAAAAAAFHGIRSSHDLHPVFKDDGLGAVTVNLGLSDNIEFRGRDVYVYFK
jgi:hypothetical protein